MLERIVGWKLVVINTSVEYGFTLNCEQLPRTNSTANMAMIADDSATKETEAIIKRENPLQK